LRPSTETQKDHKRIEKHTGRAKTLKRKKTKNKGLKKHYQKVERRLLLSHPQGKGHGKRKSENIE